MTRLKSAAIVVLATLLLAGCASSAGRANSGARSDQNILRRDQILQTGSRNVLDAVRALRGNWLTRRGSDSLSFPVQIRAYVDDMRLTSVEALRQISVMDVDYVRYYNGAEASARWGLDHGQGAIYVATR